jgi:hypothetical protein
MEATGVYWMPVWNVLEAYGLQWLLINPEHYKAVRGKKTDLKDGTRIAELLQDGRLEGSYVPPVATRVLRDLTRYRTKLVQRADRRPLWRPSTFVPIARTSMFVSPLVGFFDRSLQPHLDQMQHRSIDDPASYRLHQLGMWNTIEVAAEIRIDNLSMSGVDQLVDVLHCVQRAAVCSIGMLFRLQVSLEDRFENQHRRRLHNPISDCRDGQRELHTSTVNLWAGPRFGILSTHFGAKASQCLRHGA